MEVEQDGDDVPDDILEDAGGEYLGRWHRDGSGPREYPSLGPKKQVKSMLKNFNGTLRGHSDVPWEWGAETRTGSGCGSHAHLAFDGDFGGADRLTGMTVSWNACVELAPFLAPFWCFDWEEGFRGSVDHWASPQTTRYSQNTMGRKLSGGASRSYDAVTLNPASAAGKPVTIELRLNENHPSFALVGLTYLRRTITKAVRDGASPKLAGDRGRTLNELYAAVYNASEYDGGLVEALKDVGPIRFEEGRGIPGSDVEEYDSAWDVLTKVLAVNGVDRGAYDDHVKKLVQAAGGELPGTPVVRGSGSAERIVADGGEARAAPEYGPQNNTRAMWMTLDDDFSWEVGPEVRPR